MKYYGVGYDDIGRVVECTTYSASMKSAAVKAQALAKNKRVASISVVKVSAKRRNPETVATATVVPSVSPAPVATNPCPRKNMREFIRENRAELVAAIRRVCPNCRIDEAEIRMWILNDEGLYRWARSEGVRI